MFVPGKHFEPILMFEGKAGAYLVEYLSSAPLEGRLLALPTNTRLGWKSLPGTKALAYYGKAQLTAVKSFITLVTEMK